LDDPVRFRSFASIAQELTLWFAGLFVTLAFFGLLPVITVNVESLSLWSKSSQAQLFGLFHVSLLHNAAHLVIGIAAIVAAGADRRARAVLAVTGTALLMLTLYGRLAPDAGLGELIPVSTADAWLHTVLGAAMLATAVLSPPLRGRTERPAPRRR
jgi:hypothetical protein